MVGLVWLGVSGLLGDSLLVGGAAISGLGAGMWYREFGSLGAKG